MHPLLPLFTNSTNLEIDFGLDFIAGEFGLELPLVGEKNLGPLFEKSIGIYETNFELFDNTFQLGGFNQEKVNFKIGTVPELEQSQTQIRLLSTAFSQPVEDSFLSSQINRKKVHEPSSIIGLLTLGIFGGGLIFKKSEKSVKSIKNSKILVTK